MTVDAHKNLADSLVATAPSPATSGTSLVVTAGTGVRYPAPPFDVWLTPAGTRPSVANTEIVRVTSVATDTFTIQRAAQGTTAQSVAVGWVCHAGPTAKWFTDIEQKFFFDAVADFGFVGDGKVMQEVPAATASSTIITAGANTLTLANAGTGLFTPSDVGKRITVAFAGSTSNGIVQPLVTTIATYISSTSVTLAANAVATVIAKNAVAGVSNFPIVQWGTDNSAALAALTARVNGSIYVGARVIFPQTTTNRFYSTTGAIFTKTMCMEGIGAGYSEDTGNYATSGGSTLAWWGASPDNGTAFAAFLDFTPATGLTAQRQVAPEFNNMTVDCRNGDINQALIGVRINSAAATKMDGIIVIDALAVAFDFGVVSPGVATPNAGSIGEAKDMTRGTHFGMRARMLDAVPASGTNGFILGNTGGGGASITSPASGTFSTTPQSIVIASGITNMPTAGYVWIQTTLGYPVLVRYTGGGGTTTLTGCTVSALEAINAPGFVSGGTTYVVIATPPSGTCLRIDGDLFANTCCASFVQSQFSHGTTWGPAAIEIRNSDSNQFFNCVINGGSSIAGAGTNAKPGVRLCGSNLATTVTGAAPSDALRMAARNNVFYGGSAGAGGVVAQGGLTAPSTANYWWDYQTGNGEVPPSTSGYIGTGSGFYWTENGAMRQGESRVLTSTFSTVAATTELFVMSFPIPANMLRVGSTFVVRGYCNNAASTTTPKLQLRIGNTDGVITGTALLASQLTLTSVASANSWFEIECTVRSLGATGTMMTAAKGIGNITPVGSLLAVTTVTINTTQQNFLTLTLQATTSTNPGVSMTIGEITCVKA